MLEILKRRAELRHTPVSESSAFLSLYEDLEFFYNKATFDLLAIFLCFSVSG